MAVDRSNKTSQKSEELRRQTSREEIHADQPAHPLLNLQRQVGNQHVARILGQRQAAPRQRAPKAAAEELIQAQRDGLLQRATEVARDVPEVGLEGGPISAGLAGRIQSKRGGGAPLADTTRNQMEGAFGTSFEHVRLHTDAESASISRSLGAKAATTGSDIFFGQGASPGDKSLLAHELTHVVQQSSMSGGGGAMTVNKEGDNHEQAANAMARAVTSGSVMTKREPEDQ